VTYLGSTTPASPERPVADFKSEVVDFIHLCRTLEHGIPMFRTHFAGLQFSAEGKPAVLAVCWGGRDTIPSQYFVNVPPEDLKAIKEGTGDWRWLIRKYGTRQQALEAEVAPVTL